MDGRVVVATTAVRGSGGLGAVASEFADGAAALDRQVEYVGPPRAGLAQRLVTSRPYRRAFGMAASRRLASRAVRRSAAREDAEMVYATPECLPGPAPGRVSVVHQATRLPKIEFEALRAAEKATGGRGDMSAAELGYRERELQKADLIHVSSLRVRDEFLEAGFPHKKIVHSYLGVDLDRYRPGRKDPDLTVAFVGPLSMRKGVDYASAVAKLLSGRGAVVAVGGPTCPWSRAIADEAPFVRGDSVPDTLAKAQALILPSRSDGFSYVVLEALASGTVPIVTPAVGAAEVVARLDPALVVDEEHFAENAVGLLTELDLSELGSRARDLAEEFDREKTSREMAAKILAAGLTENSNAS